MGLEKLLLFAGIFAEAVAAAFLIYRRGFRTVPVFCIFLIWGVPSDLTMMYLFRRFGGTDPRYYNSYLIESSIDFLVQFAVLVELAWSVLRPIRAALPRRTILVISALLLLLGAASWPIAGRLTLAGPTHQWHVLMQLEQSFSMLRVAFMLILAAFSQLLAIGWRDRELQIATGLGFYSLLKLGAAIVHTQHQVPVVYHNVDLIVTAGYACSLVYWAVSFAQQEAPRQEFTPRMESFLLAVSGAARTQRMTLDQLRKTSK